MLELDIRLQYPCLSPAKRARRCRTMARQATGPSHWPRRRKLREPNSCRLIQIHCHLVSCLVDESRARNASRATSRSIIGPAPPLFFVLILFDSPCPASSARRSGVLGGNRGWPASSGLSFVVRPPLCLCQLGWVVWDGWVAKSAHQT